MSNNNTKELGRGYVRWSEKESRNKKKEDEEYIQQELKKLQTRCKKKEVTITTEDYQNTSMINQTHLILDYCEKENILIDIIYSDWDITGSTIKRPGLQQAIKDSQEQKYQILIFKHADRISRSDMQGSILFELEEEGVKPISLMGGIEDEMSQATTQFIGKIPVIQGRRKARISMQQKQEKGLPFFQAPYGYTTNKKTKKWKINPKQAKKVREAYELIIQGKNWKEIIQTIGITQGRYYRIIKNKAYIGIVTYQKKIKEPLTGELTRIEKIEYQGTHQPIIDIETYEKVQKKINKNKFKKNKS